MTTLRRLMGFPRIPIRIYVLIIALLVAFAYTITGPAYQFFTKLRSSLGSSYEPKDRERQEYLDYLKTIEQKEQ